MITDGDIDGALRELHAVGVGLSDATLLLCREAGLAYGPALELICAHPHWSAETEQIRPLLQTPWR
jgi:hypothetical protein